MTKYIRKRFLEMEIEMVEDKIKKSDEIRKEENRKRENILKEAIDRLEKRMDRVKKRMDNLVKEVGEMKRKLREKGNERCYDRSKKRGRLRQRRDGIGGK